MKNLNIGSFEGVTGCDQLLLMKINLVHDLMFVLRYAELKNGDGELAVTDLFSLCSNNPKTLADVAESFDLLLTWLFLNARTSKDEKNSSSLGNQTQVTPSTLKVREITEMMTEIFLQLSDNYANEEAIKVALKSMTNIVRTMNTKLLNYAERDNLGFDVTCRLSEKTNEIFT